MQELATNFQKRVKVILKMAGIGQVAEIGQVAGIGHEPGRREQQSTDAQVAGKDVKEETHA